MEGHQLAVGGHLDIQLQVVDPHLMGQLQRRQRLLRRVPAGPAVGDHLKVLQIIQLLLQGIRLNGERQQQGTAAEQGEGQADARKAALGEAHGDSFIECSINNRTDVGGGMQEKWGLGCAVAASHMRITGKLNQ